MPFGASATTTSRPLRSSSNDAAGFLDLLRRPWAQDMVAAGWFLAAMGVLLCLASFHPDDPSYFFYHPTMLVQNVGGLLGATLAEGLLQVFGMAGYLVPPMMAVAGLAWSLRGSILYHARWMACAPLLIASTAGLFHLLLPRGLFLPGVAPGGLLGVMWQSLIVAGLPWGGLLVSLSVLLLIAVVGLSGLGPVEFFVLSGLGLRSSFSAATAGGWWLGGKVCGFLSGFVSGPGYSWSASAYDEPVVEFEDLEEVQEEIQTPDESYTVVRPQRRAASRQTAPRPAPKREPLPLSQRLQENLVSELNDRAVKRGDTTPERAPAAAFEAPPVELPVSRTPTIRERTVVTPGVPPMPFQADVSAEPTPEPAQESPPEPETPSFDGWPFSEEGRPAMSEPMSMGDIEEEELSDDAPEEDVLVDEEIVEEFRPDAEELLDEVVDDGEDLSELEEEEELLEEELAAEETVEDDIDEAPVPDEWDEEIDETPQDWDEAEEDSAEELSIDEGFEEIEEFEEETEEEELAEESGEDDTPVQPIIRTLEGVKRPETSAPAPKAPPANGPLIRPRAETSFGKFVQRAEEDYAAQDAAQADDDPAPWEDDSPFEDDSQVGIKKEAAAPLKLPSELEQDDDESGGGGALEVPLTEEQQARTIRYRLARATITVPGAALLNEIPDCLGGEPEEVMLENANTLVHKLKDFRIDGHVSEIVPGPVVTRYEYVPAPGVKVSKITNLTDDLSMAMRCKVPPRIALIPGKSALGIEVPNSQRELVSFAEVVRSKEFTESASPLSMAIGKDTEGRPFVTDLAAMPHLLVAGTTGSGKSVCINTMLMSLIMFRSPLEVQLVLVDPKMLELSIYNDIPHLRSPVVTDPGHAATALQWAVNEMEDRYGRLSAEGVRNIKQYNNFIRERAEEERWSAGELKESLMPYIVIVIDELADLMVVASNEVETSVMRLAQMARAAGIHLILATQRPSVDVITGVIKANFPSRLAFRVSQKVDSRTIIDEMGADRLLGNGDMLLRPPGTSRLIRLHGAYVSEDEINRIVDFWKEQQLPAPQGVVEDLLDDGSGDEDDGLVEATQDEYFIRAVELIISSGHASISMLQRRFRVGYARAARLVDMMERHGIVGKFEGSKPREVLVDSSYVEKLKKML